MIVLTPEQHDEWVHLCGRPGRGIFPHHCRGCLLHPYCVGEHAILGQDFILARSRRAMREVGEAEN
jgi:hypothetical protein